MKRRASSPAFRHGPGPGLCERCTHAHRIENARGSVFWRCRLSETDPRFPRYPRLPVLACDGYDPVDVS